jgi:hypothetical protein
MFPISSFEFSVLMDTMKIFIGILPSLVQLTKCKSNFAHETKMSRAEAPRASKDQLT